MSSDNYTVGYAKPPKSGQFKKGKSGNKKGRPKGARSLKTVLQAELAQKLPVKEDGKVRKISKMEALAKKLVANALSGDARALSELLRQVNLHLGDVPDVDHSNTPASEDDAAMLMQFVKRALKQKNEEGE